MGQKGKVKGFQKAGVMHIPQARARESQKERESHINGIHGMSFLRKERARAKERAREKGSPRASPRASPKARERVSPRAKVRASQRASQRESQRARAKVRRVRASP